MSMNQRLLFEGQLDLRVNGSRAEVLGQREGIILRVARVSDLVAFRRILDLGAAASHIIQFLSSTPSSGVYSLAISEGERRCAATGQEYKPSWIASTFLRIPLQVFWAALLRAWFQPRTA
jgi:hypothetical protein